MKSNSMFNYDFLFGDHFARLSNEAKLAYIEMNFFAINGFVANPISIIDSRGYDKSVLTELINNGDLLSLEGRSEVFVTAYFIHNKGINYKTWWNSPYAIYWRGKLFIKENSVATFKNPNQTEEKMGFSAKIDTSHIEVHKDDNDLVIKPYEEDDEDGEEFSSIIKTK